MIHLASIEVVNPPLPIVTPGDSSLKGPLGSDFKWICIVAPLLGLWKHYLITEKSTIYLGVLGKILQPSKNCVPSSNKQALRLVFSFGIKPSKKQYVSRIF